jgi:hypothetical protein
MKRVKLFVKVLIKTIKTRGKNKKKKKNNNKLNMVRDQGNQLAEFSFSILVVGAVAWISERHAKLK